MGRSEGVSVKICGKWTEMPLEAYIPTIDIMIDLLDSQFEEYERMFVSRFVSVVMLKRHRRAFNIKTTMTNNSWHFPLLAISF